MKENPCEYLNPLKAGPDESWHNGVESAGDCPWNLFGESQLKVMSKRLDRSLLVFVWLGVKLKWNTLTCISLNNYDGWDGRRSVLKMSGLMTGDEPRGLGVKTAGIDDHVD